MNLSAISTALLNVGVPVDRYEALQRADKYIVWSEDGEGDSLIADNKLDEQVISGSADYFTKTENDPNVKLIQAAFDADDDIAWSLNSIQYEEETGYIHYEWLWQVIIHG